MCISAESRAHLNLQPGATKNEVEKAYKRQSLRDHPDKGGTDEAFRRTKEARDVLLSPIEIKEQPIATVETKRNVAKTSGFGTVLAFANILRPPTQRAHPAKDDAPHPDGRNSDTIYRESNYRHRYETATEVLDDINEVYNHEKQKKEKKLREQHQVTNQVSKIIT